MPTHHDRYFSGHKAEDLFEIVADVEKYPEFLPWVQATRITERHEDYFVADLVVKFKHFTQKYTSKVAFCKPGGEGNPEINVSLIKGPFKRLHTNWLFEQAENGTYITFDMDFKFESMILDRMIGFIFEAAVKKMTDAFTKRADDILKPL